MIISVLIGNNMAGQFEVNITSQSNLNFDRNKSKKIGKIIWDYNL